MKNTMIATWCAAGTLFFASCDAGSGKEQTSTEATSQSATVASADSSLTDDKKELLAFAARHNMLEIELGKLAHEKGTSDAVRSYAQNQVDLYTTKHKELQELAQQYNATLPQQLDEEGKQHLAKLREAKNFNEAYWEHLTNAQKHAIDEFDSRVEDIEPADATAYSMWARNSLKELQAQYEQAKGREVELKRRDTGISPE